MEDGSEHRTDSVSKTILASATHDRNQREQQDHCRRCDTFVLVFFLGEHDRAWEFEFSFISEGALNVMSEMFYIPIEFEEYVR